MADLGTTIKAYLAGKSAITALVGTRIYPDVLPQGYDTKTQGGAIVYSVISTLHDHLINGLSGIARARLEFTTYSSSRIGANAIAEAIRTSGLVGYTGAMGAMVIESVRIESGVQFLDELPTDGTQGHRYLTIFDYLIAYQETV